MPFFVLWVTFEPGKAHAELIFPHEVQGQGDVEQRNPAQLLWALAFLPYTFTVYEE